MKTITALERLMKMDDAGRAVYSTGDLARLFGEPRSSARLSGTLTRLVSEGILSRPTRGVYVFAPARSLDASVLARIALVARAGETCVESFETAASKHGLISQAYGRFLTVATTGRSGRIESDWGRIEFVHVSATSEYLRDNSRAREGLPMRIATETLCLAHLKRSGRAHELLLETREGTR